MKKIATTLLLAAVVSLGSLTPAHAEVSAPPPPPTVPMIDFKAVFKHCVPVMKRNEICWTYDAGKLNRARYEGHVKQSDGKVLWIVVWGR